MYKKYAPHLPNGNDPPVLDKRESLIILIFLFNVQLNPMRVPYGGFNVSLHCGICFIHFQTLLQSFQYRIILESFIMAHDYTNVNYKHYCPFWVIWYNYKKYIQYLTSLAFRAYNEFTPEWLKIEYYNILVCGKCDFLFLWNNSFYVWNQRMYERENRGMFFVWLFGYNYEKGAAFSLVRHGNKH